RVVSEYVTNKRKVFKPNSLLIVLESHNNQDRAQILDAVKILSIKYETTICYSDVWSPYFKDLGNQKKIPLQDQNLEEIKTSMQKADVLFLANPSYASIAKLALLIDDTLEMWIAIQMQLNGKKVVLAKDYCFPRGTQNITMPHSVSRKLQNYLKQLREGQIELIMLGDMSSWLDTYFEEDLSQNRPVVLAKHIE
ncbi:hypothetical protein, partial [Streptomyces gulbargensis]